MATFSGFSTSDFAAYEEKKWGSNAFTLERMKVKEKLQGLQTRVAALFSEDFAAHLSEEFPNIVNHKRVDSQWLYYTRSAAQAGDLARFLEKTELKPETIFNLAPQDKHTSLAVLIDQTHVHVGLLAHAGAWVDRKNFAAKLEEGWAREKLKTLLGALDPELRLGFDQETVPAHDMEIEALASLQDMLVSEQRRFVLWRQWSKDDAIAAGADFAESVKQIFTALLPIYTFFSWSRQNDQIQVGQTLQKQKAEQRKNSTEFKVGDRVRVTSGLFAGKTGAVQSIDSKAHVRVQVGPMAVTLAASDLARG